MPRSKPSGGLKVAVYTSAGVAILFVVFGGISKGYSLKSVLVLATGGAFLGAIAAPEFAPDAFPQPRIWQMFFSILGCLLIAFACKAGPVGYASAVLIGAVLGYFARYWVEHIGTP